MGRTGAGSTLTTGRSAHFAYRRLRELIVHGQLAPGRRIVEADLAERLGVSRTPIRGALQRLEQEGLLLRRRIGSRSRTVVAPLTREDAKEIFEVVGALEGLAAWRAATLESAERARVARSLREANDELRRCARSSQVDGIGFYERDQAFHEALVRAASGPRLLRVHGAARPQAERYIRVYVSTLHSEVETSVREHELIVREVERGAPELARAATQTNWRNAIRRLFDVIGVLGERGGW
jgi:DNA-binding GntR family transcriptional regulator